MGLKTAWGLETPPGGPWAGAGTGTGEAAPLLDSERKQVTALDAELLADPGLDHETLHRLFTRFFQLASQEIGAFGGVIKQFLDSGLLALFGAPLAHEDHALRGVLAAKGLRRAVARWAQELSAAERIQLTLRVGIDTGLAVVGGVGDMAVGPLTRQANQLRQAARDHEILIGAQTTRLVRHQVGVEEVERHFAQGSAAVHRVTDHDDAERSLALSPFVGRKKELGVLSEVLQLAASGHGQVVGISGEPGTGKSRLLYEVRRRISQRPLVYLRGECVSYGAGIPYLPFVNMLRRASTIDEREDLDQAAAKLRTSLETLGLAADHHLPFLLRLLDTDYESPLLAELEPQAIKARTFQTLIDMTLHASRQALVVLELEDLQWIDATSDDFLLAMVEALAAAPILVVGTYRSGYQPRWLDRSYATQLSLRRLNEADSRTLVHAALGAAAADRQGDSQLPDLILEKAEGNPFFLEELARALAEGRSDGVGSVPSTIQGVLMARIDRLPEAPKRLLQVASVLGREFSRELLAEIWDRPEQDLGRLLLDLQSWEFVFEQPSREGRYVFKHALTQDVAYESLLLGRRQALHRATAQALERLCQGRLEEVLDRLIYHYPRAGEPGKTVHYLKFFAQRAARNFAHAEAARALREALAQAKDLPDPPRESIELLLRLAESLLPLAEFPQCLKALEENRHQLESLGDAGLAAKYFFWMAHTHSYMGHQTLSSECARRSISHAREAGDEATEGLAHYVLGRDGFWSGQFALGAESSLRAVVLLERSNEPWWQGQAYWTAAFNFFELGQFERAFDALERAKAIGHALADPRLDPTWTFGHFHASLGDADRGITHCRKAVSDAKDPLNGAVASGFLGHALLEKGDFTAAIACLEPALAAMKSAEMGQIHAWFAAYLAEAYAAGQRFERAQQVGEEGLAVAEKTQFRYGIALATRILGVIALRLDQPLDARRWLERARATFEQLETPFEVGRTLLHLGQLEEQGPARAAILAQAANLFDQLQVAAYRARCEAAADP